MKDCLASFDRFRHVVVRRILSKGIDQCQMSIGDSNTKESGQTIVIFHWIAEEPTFELHRCIFEPDYFECWSFSCWDLLRADSILAGSRRVLPCRHECPFEYFRSRARLIGRCKRFECRNATVRATALRSHLDERSVNAWSKLNTNPCEFEHVSRCNLHASVRREYFPTTFAEQSDWPVCMKRANRRTGFY